MLLPENNVFKSVKVNKDELLKVIRDNKEKHIHDYEEAVHDYKLAVIKVSENNVKVSKKRLDNAKKGIYDFSGMMYLTIPKEPKSYEAEYNRAIRMLEMSVETDLDVDAIVFNQLALDEWQWKNDFILASSAYKGML